jgi:hypothetical protein
MKLKKTASESVAKYKKTIFVMIFLLCIAGLIFFGGKDDQANDKGTSQKDIPVVQRSEFPAPQTVIRRILLQPSQPTRRDTLHAEIVLSEFAKTSGKHFQYVYSWKVNNQPVPGSTNTLELADFNVGDWVAVVVIPYDNDVAAPNKASPPVTIRAVRPSLDLHVPQTKIVSGETFECRLVSEHPDSKTVTFALEEPRIEGMRINEKTGRIAWDILAIEKKTWQFSASVSDPAGLKTTKTFTISLNPDSAASPDPASTDTN